MAKKKTKQKRRSLGNMLPKEPKGFSRENGQDLGHSLNAPPLSDWLTGPWDDQASYLCSCKQRWSTYCGTRAASGRPVTQLGEPRPNEDALSQICKTLGYDSWWNPAAPSPSFSIPASSSSDRVWRSSWDRRERRLGVTVSADPALRLVRLSGWVAASLLLSGLS